MCSFLGAGSGPAIIAVIGTLGGAAFGGGFTYWQQRRQREHEDLVRFHQIRLDAYDKFARAAAPVLAKAITWVTKQTGKSLEDFLATALEALNAAYPRVGLVASQPVFDAASNLHTKLHEIWTGPQPPDVVALQPVVIVLLANFQTAVRHELGISNVTTKVEWVDGSLTIKRE
jgi:ABC-type glycerol-3-phosphate transport system substrate-binding protein